MTHSSKKVSSTGKTNRISTPIAVIGIGSVFPQARNTQEYWDNILNKIDCISEVPESRWSIADYYDPDPAVPDKTYCKRGGFIPDIDFDPMEFGLPPNILEVTDVSQLLALVVARDALEDAGYGEKRVFNREGTGCILGFVGTSSKLFTPLMTRLQYPVWEKVLRSAGVPEDDTKKIIEKIKLGYVGWEENSFPGAIGNVVTGRICNRFDLGGTNCVVDAACASSLAAVRMAVGELIEHRADMMITGGIDTDNSINSFMCFSKTPAFTRMESVRPFDAESGGMMVGEGLGMIVLKRLEDAERDGDRVYAVIKAIGTSSDGRFKSIYAPRSAGQAKALRRAYEEAGFEPASVGLIEAHGTGTVAGDPAEFEGLRDAFSENNPQKNHIALGSVKSQIAHTKAAAGVASLIKISMALHHKILPPTINVTRPNPKLGIENTPFYLNTETRPWIVARNGTPRRAGVSSFGFGGTNFHVVLEEYTAEQSGAYRLTSVAQPILLAASTPAQLLAACRDAYQKLQGDLADSNFVNLVQASRGMEIPAAAARVGFVALTPAEAAQTLQVCIDTLVSKPAEETWEHPKGIYYRKSGLGTKGAVVALFSGQGSQYLEMGRELANNFPVMREVFGAVDALFLQDGKEALSSRVYPRPVFDAKEREALSETLTFTENAQPAIGSISVGLYKLLQQAGFRPDFTAGHSFGELTALWAAGVISEADFYALAKARGKAMAPPEDPGFDAGTMLAVKGDAAQIRAALTTEPEVTLANWNSNDQVVIAGSKPAIARAQKTLDAAGFKTIPLPVSAAFHTPLVAHAQKPFAKAIRAATFHKPAVRVYSNGTAQPHADDPKAIQARLAEHILNPVLFRDEIENIYAAGGRIFVEFGPKNVLTNLVGNILAGRPHLAVALNASPKKDSDRQLREAVVALLVAGLPLKNFDPYQVERKAAAPRKKSPVTVKLNGGYYVSEKTRSAFEKALNDGFRIHTPAGSQAATPAQQAAPAVVPAATPQAQLPARPQQAAAQAAALQDSPIAQALAEYQASQSETLRLHEQYLRMEEEYARAFAQMTELQSGLVARLSAAPGEMQAVLPLFESLERSMVRFHEHQSETLRVHQRYIETQDRFSQSFSLGIQTAGATPAPAVQSRPAPVVPAAPVQAAPRAVEILPAAPGHVNGSKNGTSVLPAAPAAFPAVSQIPAPARVAGQAAELPKAAPTGPGAEQLREALLAIVSEKTGYPVETLELDMDMEADLGIDSIKRVEILGAMQTQFPELPKVEAAVLAELRTLGQIVDQFNLAGGPVSNTAEPGMAAMAPIETLTAEVSTAAASVVDTAGLVQALLEIVSEKTGYPAETLELDMDMEADLGIDSIKRVEILGAMQTQFPELPKVEAAVLAELRTLGQITEAMSAAPAPAMAELSAPAEPVAETKAAPPAAAYAVEQVSVSTGELSQALLEIVSEKTGYPAETLEMDMDMEADLGIDSIKRVEILGAMQTRFPDLPKVDAAALAELRTLGQIVEQMRGVPGYEHDTMTDEALPEGVGAQSPFDLPREVEEPYFSGIEQGVVIRRILPAPDYMEFVLPDGHVCLVTDDGTPAAPALVQALLDNNWPVVVLHMPETVVPRRLAMPQGAANVVLEDLSEIALESLLADIHKKYGPPAVFINLARSSAGSTGAEKALLKFAFLAAKYLKPALNEAAQKGRAAFLAVTSLDGAFGTAEDMDFAPVNGGIFGLVKTLNLEWEAVFCRAIDLSPALEPAQAVEYILAELHDPNRLVAEVGYTQNERSTLGIASVPVTGVK